VTDPGIIIAFIGLAATAVTALIAFWRFRRKDRADAQQVEEGTISGRFKDADALMRYIDERVEERTAAIEKSLDEMRAKLTTVSAESREMHDAVRARETQLWLWNQKGRLGVLPMLPDPILHRLGLGSLADDEWHTEPRNPT
jgi:hypothetical protein